MSQMLVLEVKGMDCEGCERSIAKALEPLAGVESVRASHKDGRVEVDGTPEEAAVKEAIEAAGYDVVSA